MPIDSAKGNSSCNNVDSPTVPTHRINGMRTTLCWSGKRAQALQTTMRSLKNVSTEHELEIQVPTATA